MGTFKSEGPSRSRTAAGRRVLVFTPGAPAVQVLVAAMWALDRGKLVVGFSRRSLAVCWCGSNRNYKPARLALTQPAGIDIPRHHLMRHADLHVAQAR